MKVKIIIDEIGGRQVGSDGDRYFGVTWTARKVGIQNKALVLEMAWKSRFSFLVFLFLVFLMHIKLFRYV